MKVRLPVLSLERLRLGASVGKAPKQLPQIQEIKDSMDLDRQADFHKRRAD
jgi:hypothetical protein